MLKIYGIKNCDSVRKAVKYFKAHEIPYEFIDFRETPITEETISEWLKHADISKLFNTRGTTYRTLKLKAMNLSDTDKAMWLSKENMLIKRPVIVFDDTIIIGYNESEYLEKLSKSKG
jgi:Spx/MgsR family transcriptional regulator